MRKFTKIGTVRLVLGVIVLILGIVLTSVVAIGSWIQKWPQRLSVEAEALRAASLLITAIEHRRTEIQLTTLPDLAKCESSLRESLATNKGQYSLKVTSAFDANDVRFASKVVNAPIGNREATTMVIFPDGTNIELYSYNGKYENCRLVIDP